MSKNLMDFDRKDLEAYFRGLNEKPFRAQQLFKWIYKAGQFDFSQMYNLGKDLRDS